MARATRVDFPGAWYHVLNRGIERLAIFRSTRCCEKFIELLSSLPERFGVRLHGYASMGNHYHLQLESREANLSKALHWLIVSYSVWFHRKCSPDSCLLISVAAEKLAHLPPWKTAENRT
jgi:putative transposase